MKIEIILASAAGFINNYCLSNVFPYAASMVVQFGLVDNIDHAGYYVGFLASSFMFARCFTSLFWGQLSDDYGRRPILIMCTFTSFLFTLIFGLSQNFAIALLARFLLGFFSANVGLAKTIISESVEPNQQRYYLSYLIAFSNLGTVIGPAMGGWFSFSTPESKDSNLFKLSNKILAKFGINLAQFPFLLSNLIISIFSLGIFLLSVVAFKETKKSFSDEGEHEPFIDEKSEPPPPSGQTSMFAKYFFPFHEIKKLLGDECKEKAAMSYCYFSLVHLAFTEVLSLWLQSSKQKLGLNFSITQTGMVLSVASIFLMFFMIGIFPLFSKRITLTDLFAGTQLVLAIFFFFLPEIARIDMNFELSLTSITIVVICCVSVILISMGITFVVINNLVNNSCDSSERGAMNGLVMMLGSVSKSFGPFLCAQLYAWSIEGDKSFPFDNHLVFYFLTITSIFLVHYALKIPKSLNS